MECQRLNQQVADAVSAVLSTNRDNQLWQGLTAAVAGEGWVMLMPPGCAGSLPVCAHSDQRCRQIPRQNIADLLGVRGRQRAISMMLASRAISTMKT